MRWKLPLSLLFVNATLVTTHAQLIWNVGRDDNAWNLTGTGGGPSTVFVQEQGAINPLPGVPNNAPTVPASQSADNDYYFSGVYSSVVPSVSSFYGAYTPVGVVPANEEAAERAYAGGDLDLRYHFNLANTVPASSMLSVSFDALNFHIDPALNPDPRFGVEIYVNGVLVMPQVILRPVDLDRDITSPLFSQASVNLVRGPGPDNIVTLKGISYNATGGGNWMGVDYVQLDSQPVPEPSSAMMILCGALGAVPFLRRRRA